MFGQPPVSQPASPRRKSRPVRKCPPCMGSEMLRLLWRKNRAEFSTIRSCRTWAAPNHAFSLRAYQRRPPAALQRCQPIADQRWSPKTSMWRTIGWRMTWEMFSQRRNGEFLSIMSRRNHLGGIRIISPCLRKCIRKVCDIEIRDFLISAKINVFYSFMFSL